MKKFFLSIILLTVLSFLHVYNKTNIYILGYDVESCKKDLSELSDQRSFLVSRLQKQISYKELSSNIYDDYTCNRQLVKIDSPSSDNQNLAVKKKETLLSKIFSLTQQAEAKP